MAKRKYRRTTNAVNDKLKMPVPPHDGIDYESCICGDTYRDFRAFVGSSSDRFSEAANNCRIAFGGWESGGGYRSFGNILFMLKIMKTAAFFEAHIYHTPDVFEFIFCPKCGEQQPDPDKYGSNYSVACVNCQHTFTVLPVTRDFIKDRRKAKTSGRKRPAKEQTGYAIPKD